MSAALPGSRRRRTFAVAVLAAVSVAAAIYGGWHFVARYQTRRIFARAHQLIDVAAVELSQDRIEPEEIPEHEHIPDKRLHDCRGAKPRLAAG